MSPDQLYTNPIPVIDAPHRTLRDVSGQSNIKSINFVALT
jgi:hypothetical protein